MNKGFTFTDNFRVTGNDRVIKYTFGDYGGLNSQNCLSKQIRNELESNLSFITEPYAWLMGQAFKYMLKTTPYFNELLEEYLRELKIDFDLPIVGYKLLFFNPPFILFSN